MNVFVPYSCTHTREYGSCLFQEIGIFNVEVCKNYCGTCLHPGLLSDDSRWRFVMTRELQSTIQLPTGLFAMILMPWESSYSSSVLKNPPETVITNLCSQLKAGSQRSHSYLAVQVFLTEIQQSLPTIYNFTLSPLELSAFQFNCEIVHFTNWTASSPTLSAFNCPHLIIQQWSWTRVQWSSQRRTAKLVNQQSWSNTVVFFQYSPKLFFQMLQEGQKDFWDNCITETFEVPWPTRISNCITCCRCLATGWEMSCALCTEKTEYRSFQKHLEHWTKITAYR